VAGNRRRRRSPGWARQEERVSTFIGSRRYRRCFAMTMYPGVVGGWQRVLIRNVRYSFSGSAPRLSAWLEDRSQIRGECSERLAWAHSSSGHALLAGMRLAASMRAARAGSPRSSKSSRAARCSNRVAPCGRASLRAALMSARRASGSARAGLFGLLGGGQQPRGDGVVAQEPSVQRTRSPTAGTASG
jgi:hypothetical protein